MAKKQVREIKESIGGAKPKYTIENTIKLLDDMIEWMEAEDENVFIMDFLSKRNISMEKYSKFFVTFPWLREKYDVLKQKQEIKLLKLGLFKKIDSSLTKFVLSAHHGYSEKIETTNTNVNTDVKMKDLVKFSKKKKKK